MGSMFRLGESSVRPAAGTKIIKADEYALYLEASSLLDAAREKAAAMEAQAEEAYERKKEEGYRDGMEEGKLEHAEKMMETILSSVEFIEGIEDTLVSVVNQAIRKIIGEMDGKETVQWYVCDPYSSITRPVKELKHFEKRLLRSGEEHVFTFEIDPVHDLSFVDSEGNRFVEPGDFYIIVKDMKAKITLVE